MKTKKSFAVIILICFVMVSCQNTPDKKDLSSNKNKLAHSYEIDFRGKNDTINVVDANGLKQGLWIERNNDKDPLTKDIDTVTYKDGVVLTKN